jgi:hypothetical protein
MTFLKNVLLLLLLERRSKAHAWSSWRKQSVSEKDSIKSTHWYNVYTTSWNGALCWQAFDEYMIEEYTFTRLYMHISFSVSVVQNTWNTDL